MNLHKIHDLSDQSLIHILENGLLDLSDSLMNNYSPYRKFVNSNLFYVLANGRYRCGDGAYYILEENGKYIASAGWNIYEDKALVLTRAYVAKEYRTSYIMGTEILPLMLMDCDKFSTIWMSFNEYNLSIYNWFIRKNNGLKPTLFTEWPAIYNDFKPIGKRLIYNVEQYVVERKRYE